MSSASNRATWQMVRMRRSTVNALRSVMQRLDNAYTRGQGVEPPGEQGYSLDQIVMVLVNRDEGKRHRAERSRCKKQCKARAEASSAPAVSTPSEGSDPCIKVQ